MNELRQKHDPSDDTHHSKNSRNEVDVVYKLFIFIVEMQTEEKYCENHKRKNEQNYVSKSIIKNVSESLFVSPINRRVKYVSKELVSDDLEGKLIEKQEDSRTYI